MRHSNIGYEFVEFVPPELEAGKLYVSIEYATAVHLCACGCGKKVVTPISPAEWQLIYDGDSVSLHPSIGNWQFPCRSHYWIRRNKINWARQWSKQEIEKGRERDKFDLESYYADRPIPPDARVVQDPAPATRRVIGRLKRLLRL